MATGEKHANIYNKRLMSQDAWDQYFFLYLDDKVDDALQAVFLQSGTLDDDPILLESTANDTFTLDISDASRGVDGSGRIMDLNQVDVSFYEEYPFENDTGETYYVGLKYADVPDDVERNARLRLAQYPWNLDTIGEVGVADSINDTGTEIELTIDGTTQVGVDHGDRPVMVWLTNPVSSVASVAYFNGTITYTGGVNKVIISYSPTLGPLGQTAPEFPISTTASDYNIWIKGVSWFEGVDISTDPNYVYIGKITGNGPGATPTVFDISGQRPIFLISLDRAYRANSPDTPAPGRTIFADKHAVRIVQDATSSLEQDPFNTAFHFDKNGESFTGFSVGKRIEFRPEPFSITSFDAVRLFDGADLLESEAVTVGAATDVITFTRGAIDLTTFFDQLSGSLNYVLVSGTASDDGYYFIQDTLTAATLQVINIDGSAVSFTGGSGDTKIYMMSMSFVFGDPLETSHTGLPTLNLIQYKSQDGIIQRMAGAPVDPEIQTWAQLIVTDDPYNVKWFNLYTGRSLVQAGGSTYVNIPRTNGIVSGWANYQADKREVNVGSDFEPDEADNEWGFDYRGSAFGKVGSPGYQLAATDRIPFTLTDGATQLIIAEEPFTAFSATQLQFTRGGDLDLSYIPAWHYHGKSFVWAEIQFDTPSVSDGVYSAELFTAPDKLTFRTVDGTQAAFTATETGVVRFYGGMYSGTYWMNAGSELRSYVTNIIAPTRDSGALRMWSLGNQAIGSPLYKYHLGLATGYDDTSFGFGVRDGGVVFARSLTTRDWSTAHELTQWDQIDTALVNTDLVVSDEIDLDESVPRSLLLPTTLANGDVVKRNGGGTWTVTRQINLMKGENDNGTATGTTIRRWSVNRSIGALVLTIPAAGMTGQAEHIASLHLPQNAVVTNFNVRCTPHEGDGGADAVGIRVYRKSFTGSPEYLRTVDVVRANGGDSTLQTIAYAIQQNGTIDNNTYTYNIALQSSDDNSGSFTDYFLGAEVTFTVAKLGENWFDAF